MAEYFAIRRLTLSTVTWKEVAAPISCSRIVLHNEDDTYVQDVRTNFDDQDTQRYLLPGQDLVIQSPVATWNRNDIVCYVRAQTGVGPVTAEFTR